jgi:hypothetical protein
MKIVLGPWPSPLECRKELVRVGYTSAFTPPGRPEKWTHKTSGRERSILKVGKKWKIVDYPDLRRLDYRVTSDADRARSSQRIRLDLRPGLRRRART